MEVAILLMMVTVLLPVCNVHTNELLEEFFQDYCGHTFDIDVTVVLQQSDIDDTVVAQWSAVSPQIRQLEG